jgi:phosphatidylglycerol lysyltransferase
MSRRQLLLWLLVIGFVWVVFTHLPQIRELVRTLSQGHLEWIAAAVLFQSLYFVFFTASYQAAFATVGLDSRWRDLLPVTLGSYFVNVVAPTGGASGAALFVDDAARRGQPPARAATALVLQLAVDYIGVVVVLLVGLGYLYSRNVMQAYQVLGGIVMVLLTGGLVGVLALGLGRPDWLRRLLAWGERVINSAAARIRLRSPLPPNWAKEHTAEFVAAAAAMRARPKPLARLALVALTAHLADLGTLYCLFLAFGPAIPLGTVIAGYSMAILFWIISPTPQGIGIVEGAMTLALTSLGVLGAVAAVVTLTFRGLAFWLPFVIGFWLLRRLRSFGGRERTLSEVWSVRLAAILVAVMGVINLLSSVTPSLLNRVRVLALYSPLEVRRGGHLTATLAGFALLLLAGSLWRHKRVAWWLTLLTLGISVVSHLTKGLDYEPALLAAGLGLWLWRLGAHFQARSDPPAAWQGLRALGAALVFTLAYGVAGFYLLDRQYSVAFGFWAAVRQTVFMFTQFYDPGLVPLTAFGSYFADSIYLVGAATLGYALIMLVRPVLLRGRATPAARAQAQAIIQAHGNSPLAPLALLDDKAYYFSPGGSVVAFAVYGRIAVTLGDPIGPHGDVAAAIKGYIEFCAQNDWQPVFYQTLPETLDCYREAGFEAVCVGHDGIVDLAGFSLEAEAHDPLRATVERLTHLGYRVEVHEPPLAPMLIDELRTVSDDWLALRETREKRFASGWFEDEYIGASRLAAVHAPDGDITAFANLLPEYHLSEVTVDLARHRRDAEPGTLDLLFARLFEWARARGYATFNLGLVPLAGVGQARADRTPERVMHYIYRTFNQVYNFHGAYEFKGKFHPTWSPRYLHYRGATTLPAAWVAVLRAHTGDSNLLRGWKTWQGG